MSGWDSQQNDTSALFGGDIPDSSAAEPEDPFASLTAPTTAYDAPPTTRADPFLTSNEPEPSAWDADLPDPEGPSLNTAGSAPAAAIGSLPLRQQRAAEAAVGRGVPEAGARSAARSGKRYEEDTLAESDWASLVREASAIGRNLKVVCSPLSEPDEVESMLQHWDLWGPLIFTLLFASLLSFKAKKTESNDDRQQIVFCVIFVIIIAGALLLTANVILLGGSVSFFQSISLLGYCIFPMNIAALVCLMEGNLWVRLVVVILAVAWSMRASVPFVAGSVGDRRRFLAVFPVMLMYVVLGWLTFIS